MSMTGGCRCGAVRYELAGDGLPLIYACHCLDCQTWSGSAFVLHAMVPEASIELSGDVTRVRLARGSETMPSEHIGCAACLTRIANINSAIPGLVVLKVGTLDRSNEAVPAVHIWISRAQSWVVFGDTPCFDKTPTPQAFAEAAAGR